MKTLNTLTTDLESKQMAADKLEERISGLTENMKTLNTLTTDLESKQMAADKLEARISGITKELQMLSDFAAGLEVQPLATLATADAVVPAKQKPVSMTNPELPTVAKQSPAIETKWASVPATPEPKPVMDAQPDMRETSRTVPKESPASSVSKLPSDSGPKNRPWIINLISSPDEAYAIRFSNTAQSKGIRTELQETTVNGTPYWRVQVTGFSSQGEANANADTIKDKLGLKDIWILKR